MSVEENRRAFITSFACAAPLLAAGSAAAFAQSLKHQDHGPAAAGGGDALVEHVDDRLAGILRDVLDRGTPLRVDEARTASAHLQVLAVHARATALDQTTRRALQRRISVHGREALIRSPIDVAHARARLERRGVTLPERLLSPPAGSPAQDIDAAIDLVLAGQTSTAFTHMAASLEALAPRLPDAAGVRLDVQLSTICDFLLRQWLLCFGLVTVFCNVAWDAELEVWCDGMWQGALFVDLAYASYC